MAQVLVMMENSLGEAFAGIDLLAASGAIPRVGSPVLKALYVLGWQDGFVSSAVRQLAASLGLDESDLAAALRALEKSGVIALRPIENDGLAVELLALSGAALSVRTTRPLGWWRYYLIVNVEDGGEG